MTSQYNFKSIQTVPPLSDFLDIVLSRTQRKTPTVVHKGYAISRIRNFYMRKVKYTRETFDEKLGHILNEFPRLDDVHPFYADLMNILYDKDHYKLALAQINTARHLIDNVAKDYVKLLKFGDSLYRCKQLKRAALGRMATIMKRQKDTLIYLEQVRQHLSRLPCIDPNTRTLLICGYPNVGKSSFMNKLTRAEVDVQPYAFTTKSLFVGHMDYKYLRWQVIDTPGILDKPLEDRNTIEMQSITAMAHLRACVLFFLDISETCGYTISQQVSLFQSIKPLFANKPLLVILNKIDLIRPEQIPAEDQALLQSLLDQGIEFANSSTVTEEGIMEVRNRAADKLLATRVEVKMKGQKIGDVLNRLHLSVPKARDEQVRPAFIPETVLRRREIAAEQAERMLARDIEEANGGAGVFNVDLKKPYMLKDQEWRYDIIPELMDGKNVADFIDPEIEEKLARLEAEEELAEQQGLYAPDEPLTAEQQEMLASLKAIKARQQMAIGEHRSKKAQNSRPLLVNRAQQKRKRTSNMEMDIDNDEAADSFMMDTDSMETGKRLRGANGKSVSLTLQRDRSVAGLRGPAAAARVTKLRKLGQKRSNLLAKRGEADRDQQASKPKHLFSGKRKAGTHDRR